MFQTHKRLHRVTTHAFRTFVEAGTWFAHRLQGGFAVGLWRVKQLTQAMIGTIEVISTP